MRISHNSDSYEDNNFLKRSFPTPNIGTSERVYEFSTDENDWFVESGSGTTTHWEKGIPRGSRLNQSRSGEAYATGLSGTFPASSETSLVTPCFDLSEFDDGLEAYANFYMAYDVAYERNFCDARFYFEYSTDSGSNWHDVIDDFCGRNTEL